MKHCALHILQRIIGGSAVSQQFILEEHEVINLYPGVSISYQEDDYYTVTGFNNIVDLNNALRPSGVVVSGYIDKHHLMTIAYSSNTDAITLTLQKQRNRLYVSAVASSLVS